MTPEDTAPQAAKLPDEWDDCLLGATVGIHGADRFAYSLHKLATKVRDQRGIPAAEAREAVAKELLIPVQREFGPYDGPIFLNDELVLGEVEDRKLIVMPR